MSKHKFRKTTVTLGILHEDDENVGDLDICAIAEFVDNGPGVLMKRDDETVVLDGKQMADALYKAGSEPGFFRLDDEGRDEDEPVFVCKTCGENVEEAEMREHLEGHNPNARQMEAGQVRNCFEEK